MIFRPCSGLRFLINFQLPWSCNFSPFTGTMTEPLNHTPPPSHLRIELFTLRRLVEASACLSEAIPSERIRRSLERLSRRAIQSCRTSPPSRPRICTRYPDAITNLGFLLFILGKREEGARLLTQSLAWSSGNSLAPVQRLLRLCSLHSTESLSADDPSPNRFDCRCGQAPLFQRGRKMGRPRGNKFHQASRCESCGFRSLESSSLEFLAEYCSGEYTDAVASRYMAEIDYDAIRCETRAPGMSSITLKNTLSAPSPCRLAIFTPSPLPPTPPTASFFIR